MRLVRTLLALLIGAVAALKALAGPGLQTLRFEHLSSELPVTSWALQCALQDDLGRMWLGTAGGLLSYDGRNARGFGSDPTNPRSLSHAWIQALQALPDGRFLVATAGGLDVFDPRLEQIERLALPGQRRPIERAVLGLAPGAGGKVWLNTHFQLLQFEPATRRFVEMPLPPDLLPLRAGRKLTLRGLNPDGAGGVWVMIGRELFHLDVQGRPLQRWPIPAPAKGSAALYGVLLDADQRAWIFGDAWLTVLDLRDGRVLDLPGRLGLPDDAVYAMLRDADETLWIGTAASGLWRWPRGAERAEALRHHPAVPSSLAGDSISALFQDRSGVLWVGSWDTGISVADLRERGLRKYRHVFSEPNTLGSDVVFAVQPDGASHAWVGSYGAGVYRLDLADGTASRLDSQEQPVSSVRSLRTQAGRGLWIGTSAGLYRLASGADHPSRFDLQAADGPGNVITSMVTGADGSLWAGSMGGLYRIGPDGRIQRFRGRNGGPGAVLEDEAIQGLAWDRRERLWVATAGGVRLYRGGEFIQPLVVGDGALDLERLSVYSIREDRGGRIWMGTQLGLVELDAAGEDRWQPRLRRDIAGMPQGLAWNLEFDAEDSLWFSGEHGLNRLSPDRRSLRRFAFQGERLGAGNVAGASAVGADGSLFFGTPGLLQIRPEAVQDNPVAPRVLLADVRVFNQSLRDPPEAGAAARPAVTLATLGVDGPLEYARALRLSHREATVGFDLQAQHFYAAGLIRYAWKLEGFDQDWIQGRPGQRLATYTNLDAGDFKLMVRVANPDGVWGEAQTLLQVQVLPPWWRTAWFRALLTLALLALLVGAWLLRVRRLHANQRMLEAEVARRTAEVQAQRQQIATLGEIGRELTASLDVDAIRTALIGQLASLMPATGFGVGLVRRDEGFVEFAVTVEQGRAYKPYRRRLDALEQPAVRCVTVGEPVWVRHFDHDNRVIDAGQRMELADGGEPTRAASALYVPLKVKGEVRGVLAALSPVPDAFSQTHLDMLLTLGAYASVAMENAEAYHRLEEAQSQLVEQRKLAAMGHLVAGVAHELNTPLGNGLLVTTALIDDGRELAARIDQGQLRRAELSRFMQNFDNATTLLLRSLEAAGRLVTAFKQLAVNRDAEPRRHFGLAELATDLQIMRRQALQEQGCTLELGVPAGLTLDSYPAPLRQVLDELLDNALEHGLAGGPGRLRLSAQAVGAQHIRLVFADDGQGIAPEHLGRIFDPFFTTRFGRGSNGLGLHLCYILVTSLLGGQISVRSEPGQGCEFEILLPLVAPSG